MKEGCAKRLHLWKAGFAGGDESQMKRTGRKDIGQVRRSRWEGWSRPEDGRGCVEPAQSGRGIRWG